MISMGQIHSQSQHPRSDSTLLHVLKLEGLIPTLCHQANTSCTAFTIHYPHLEDMARVVVNWPAHYLILIGRFVQGMVDGLSILTPVTAIVVGLSIPYPSPALGMSLSTHVLNVLVLGDLLLHPNSWRFRSLIQVHPIAQSLGAPIPSMGLTRNAQGMEGFNLVFAIVTQTLLLGIGRWEIIRSFKKPYYRWIEITNMVSGM